MPVSWQNSAALKNDLCGGIASSEASLLAADVEQCLCGFHDRCRRIPETEVSQLLDIRVQILGVDNSVAAHSIVIAAQPDRDVLRIGDFVAHELVTGHL